MEKAALAELEREDFPRHRLLTRRQAGMRYRGQSYEVSVPVPRLDGADDLADLVRRVHPAPPRRPPPPAAAPAGRSGQFAVTAVGLIPKPAMKRSGKVSAQAKPRATRTAWFSATDSRDVPVFHRGDLGPGMRIAGPAIIEEPTSTTVLHPGQGAGIDEYLNIEIAVAGGTEA